MIASCRSLNSLFDSDRFKLLQLDNFLFRDPEKEEREEGLLASCSPASLRGHEDITRPSLSVRKEVRMWRTSSLLELGGSAQGVICSGEK